MAIRKALPFNFHYVGDGVTKTVTLILAAEAYNIEPDRQNKTQVPTGVIFDTDPGDGSTIVITAGIITLTLPVAPGDGQICSFSGYLLV